ncbi:MAG: hypothetical protein ACOH2F_15645 [Cellulomonas sp.]
MLGPEILARFLTAPGDPDKYGNSWQYNSRSDRHSQVGCWGIAFDLLATSALLRHHAIAGKVVLGVNHSMADFRTNRDKKLDLVVARPNNPISRVRQSLRGLAAKNAIPLTATERALLMSLPDIPVAEVGAVLVAVEAKAAMTAHIKALPRLYDELNSSHLCVHGASNQALAIGYVHVNAAATFASSVTNNFSLVERALLVSIHNQPHDTQRVLTKISELPRRSSVDGVGFDGIGITVLNLDNQGGTVQVVTASPAPQPGAPFYYDSMIARMANEYDSRFASI